MIFIEAIDGKRKEHADLIREIAGEIYTWLFISTAPETSEKQRYEVIQ